jgi:tetratricopeptide (TPR) repeat protein
MGFFSVIKANKALRFQKSKNYAEATRLYEEAFAEGLKDPRFMMPYALMIIREGQYEKAKDFLVANQKLQMTPGQRTEMLVYYATCCFRLGAIDKGINTLEQQFHKGETGLVYQTLGYLYVEKYDQAHKPDFEAIKAEREAAEAALQAEKEAAAEEAEEQTADAPEESGEPGEEAAAPALTPEEEWNAGIEKAEAFIRKSVEYDEEDAVSLDNMAEFLYRVKGDKAAAKEWFDKAIAIKENQIDTLYFLSRYDLETGNKEAALEKLEKALGGRFSPLNYCNPDMIREEIEQLKGAL